MDNRSFKFSNVLKTLLIFISSTLFAGYVLYLSATQPDAVQSSPIWIFLAIFFIASIELSFCVLKNEFKVDTSKLSEPWDHSVLFRTARWLAVSSYIIHSFLALAFIIGFFWVIQSNRIEESATFNPSLVFYIQIAVYILYFLILRKIILKIINMARRPFKKVMPTYEIQNNGIIINFKMAQFPNFSDWDKYKAGIKFSELSEVKELTYFEARNYIDFNVGPNINLAIQALKELAQFIKGKISRPNYYFKVTANGRAVLLKGPHLLYVFTTAKDDVSDLIKAFNQSDREQLPSSD